MNQLTVKKQTTDPEAIRANTIHNFVIQRGWEMVKAAITCGEILFKKKEELKDKRYEKGGRGKRGYGNFGKWAEANLDFTWQTACTYMKLYEHQARIYDMEFNSIRAALAFIRGDDRITPGLISGDEKILRRNIVSPIKVVKARLKKLPKDPIHYDTVMRIIEELEVAVNELIDELR